MTKGELMNMLCDYAKEYCPQAMASVGRNKHMNNHQKQDVEQAVVDALIVDFVNYVGMKQGIDLALYTTDLYADK